MRLRAWILWFGCLLSATGCNSASTTTTPSPPSDQPVVSPEPSPSTPPITPTSHDSTLTISFEGAGTGSVSGSQINCGQNCSVRFDQGAVIELTAAPSSDSDFLGWSGACSGTGTCSITLSDDKTVRATFELRDMQAPTRPTGLVATAVSSSAINLTWNASSDNVGVAGYKIYRNQNSAPIATLSALSYSNTGLSPSTTYTYTVAAFDRAGNLSTQSSSASAATQAIPVTPTYTLGGQISGFSVGEVLVLRSTNDSGAWTSLTLSSGESTYQMPQRLSAGKSYVLEVVTSPSQKFCSVSNGAGVVNGNIPNINISCVPQTGNCGSGAGRLWKTTTTAAFSALDSYGVKSVVCSGDNLYVGGFFSGVAPETGPMAKISTLGTGEITSDSLFTLKGARTWRSISDGAGGWFVIGTFATGLSRNIYHLFSNNSLDQNWAPVITDANAMAFSGSYLYVATPSRIIRVNATTGVIDSSWNLSATSIGLSVQAMAVSGQYLYIGGSSADFSLGRVSIASGTTNFDSVWKYKGRMVYSIAIAGDGSIYIAGGVRENLAKIITNSNGVPIVDPLWTPSVDSLVDSISLSPSGELYLGGAFRSVNGIARNYLAKLTTTPSGGVSVSSWNPDPNARVTTVGVWGDSLYIAGNFTSVAGSLRSGLAKIALTDGAIQNWNPVPASVVRSISFYGNSIFVGGDFQTMGQPIPRNNIAKFSLTTGEPDRNWNPIPDGSRFLSGSVTQMALTEDGRSLYVLSGGSSYPSTVAKISATGTGAIDTSWNPSVAVDIGSKVVVSGTDLFMSAYGAAPGRLYKISSSGSVSLLRTDVVYNSALTASGGDIYFVMRQSSTTTLNRLRASTGELDAGWRISLAYNIPSAMTVSGGFIYVGWGSGSDAYIRKYSVTENGTVTYRFETNIRHLVLSVSDGLMIRAIAVAGNNFYVGGYFSSVSGLDRHSLAKFSSSTGALDTAWNYYTAGPSVYGAQCESIVVSGDASTVYTAEVNGLGQFSSTGW